MTQSVRRALCAVMLYSSVDLAGSVVLNNEDVLIKWSVVLNGHLEVLLPDGTIQHLHMGDRYDIMIKMTTGRFSDRFCMTVSYCIVVLL